MADHEIDVAGQRFAIDCVKRDQQYNYAWLNGPVAGYGFTSGSSEPWPHTLDDHRAAIADFLAQVDPVTRVIGVIGDD